MWCSSISPTRELSQHILKVATNPHIHNLTSQVTELNTEMRDIYRDLEELKHHCEHNALTIFNPRWLKVRGEDTDSLILDLTNNILKIKLEPSNISRSHRISRSSVSNIRPVLVKFTMNYARERIWRWREYGALHISINEDLTQVTACLAFRAREAKRSGILVDTRTNDDSRSPGRKIHCCYWHWGSGNVPDEQLTRKQKHAAEWFSLGPSFKHVGQQSKNCHDATQPPQTKGHQILCTTGMAVTHLVTPLLSTIPGTPPYATNVSQVQHHLVPGTTSSCT